MRVFCTVHRLYGTCIVRSTHYSKWLLSTTVLWHSKQQHFRTFCRGYSSVRSTKKLLQQSCDHFVRPVQCTVHTCTVHTARSTLYGTCTVHVRWHCVLNEHYHRILFLKFSTVSKLVIFSPRARFDDFFLRFLFLEDFELLFK